MSCRSANSEAQGQKLKDKLAVLTTLSSAQLRGEWLRLYKAAAPDLTADLLRRGVAWKMQEKALGGYAASTLRQIDRLCRDLDQAKGALQPPPARIKPGARLVRDWGGETHHVLVLDGGFLYREQPYPSLSRVALAITGAKWSGPRFFGIGPHRSAIDA